MPIGRIPFTPPVRRGDPTTADVSATTDQGERGGVRADLGDRGGVRADLGERGGVRTTPGVTANE